MQQMIEVYSKMIFIMLKREKLNENYHHLLKFKKRKYLLLVKTIKDILLANETWTTWLHPKGIFTMKQFEKRKMVPSSRYPYPEPI